MLKSNGNLSCTALILVLSQLIIIGYACVSDGPKRTLVEATSTIPALAEVPRQESTTPTFIASATALPPRNLVEATRIVGGVFGTLVEKGGCLRLAGSSGTGGYAIVWQKDIFNIERRGDAVLIVDLFGPSGRPSPTVIWRLGDEIRAAGGETSSEGADDHAGAGFSERCPGPYTLVSMVR